jgi:hypothetical protein
MYGRNARDIKYAMPPTCVRIVRIDVRIILRTHFFNSHFGYGIFNYGNAFKLVIWRS